MTAPTSPGVVPADVRELASRFTQTWINEGKALEEVIEQAIIEDRASRPRLTENEKADGRSNAVEAFRAWFFAHTGKRIFHANAGKAVDTVLRALADCSEPRNGGEL